MWHGYCLREQMGKLRNAKLYRCSYWERSEDFWNIYSVDIICLLEFKFFFYLDKVNSRFGEKLRFERTYILFSGDKCILHIIRVNMQSILALNKYCFISWLFFSRCSVPLNRFAMKEISKRNAKSAFLNEQQPSEFCTWEEAWLI